MNELLHKIYTRGHWQVNIRPARFAKDRVPDIKRLYAILQKTYVSLRGWNYPHLDYSTNPQVGVDWIEQQSELEMFISVWRFYQSGQFYHVFGMPIDWNDQSHFMVNEKKMPGRFLGIGDTIATFTEIFEFAARLSYELAMRQSKFEAIDEQMHVDIKIRNLDGRSLFIDSSRRLNLHEGYISSISEFTYSLTINNFSVVSKDIALKAANELFEKFNWYPAYDSLRDWQNELNRIHVTAV